MNDPNLAMATRNTLERLQRRGHLPAAQAALVHAALDEWQRQRAVGGEAAKDKGRAFPGRVTRSSAKRRAREPEAEHSGPSGSSHPPEARVGNHTAGGSSLWGQELPGPVATTLWNALEANKDAACARLVCREWAR